MQVRISHILGIAFAMTLVHFASLHFGLYEGDVWVDMPLHAAGGFGLGLFAIWVLRFCGRQSEQPFPKIVSGIIILGFGAIGSLAWEAFEFLFQYLVPQSASAFKFYSPTVSDAISDQILGLIGSAIAAISFYISDDAPTINHSTRDVNDDQSEVL